MTCCALAIEDFLGVFTRRDPRKASSASIPVLGEASIPFIIERKADFKCLKAASG
jgi:hypothetical protein